ncbi:MAG: hypothetical protein MJB57_12310 [Gemmatimonadetes bacterium]|nr:hypothetical protein [Gemmatimonadota bacterium]
MHPQLELLLEIQDLKMQRRGLADGTLGAVESDVFDIRVDEALQVLDDKVGELEGRLEDNVRERYELVSGKGPRVVAPVLNGICYGCFVAIATARSSEADRNRRVESCEYCGCFLYYVD